MKKINFKNPNLLCVISIVLSVLLFIGIASAIIFIKPKKSNEFDASKFVVGKISSRGEFVRSNDYICTNDMFGVDDLTVKPKYDAQSKFQVFFYDFKYRYVCNSGVLDSKYEFLDSVPFVEYARIMIIPDRAGLDADDFKVTVFNKADYVKEFDITVSKKQVIGKYNDYFEEDLSLRNKRIKPAFDYTTPITYIDYDGLGISKIVDVSGVNSLYFTTDKVLDYDNCPYLGFGLNGEIVSKSFRQDLYTVINDVYVYRLDCSKFNSIIFHYYLDSECHLYLDKG